MQIDRRQFNTGLIALSVAAALPAAAAPETVEREWLEEVMIGGPDCPTGPWFCVERIDDSKIEITNLTPFLLQVDCLPVSDRPTFLIQLQPHETRDYVHCGDLLDMKVHRMIRRVTELWQRNGDDWRAISSTHYPV